jgi:tRNA (Thr-GGU) A37 N-methylase
LDNGSLIVRGLDAVNHTPVLDIKPYLPQYDAFPGATIPAE